jgi:hypothetical protein
MLVGTCSTTASQVCAKVREQKEQGFFQIYVNCFKAILNIQHVTNIQMPLLL